MPRAPLLRFLLLLAAALLGLCLLEGLSRLAVRRPRRFYERMAERLPWAWNLQYQRLFHIADEGFEKTWDYPAELAEDAENFVPDPALGFRLTPGLRLGAANYTLPKNTRDKGHWLYNANTEGWRGPLSGERRKSALVLAVLGDSATYGWGLEESQSWPAQLGALLGEGAQVFNRAVPGYSSFQGTRLLPQVLEELAPAAVAIAYGGNDAISAPLGDAQMAMELQKPLGRLREFLDRFALTRLFSRMISRLKPAPPLRPRVPPEEFESNLEEMARAVQAHGSTALFLGLCRHSPAHHEALLNASKNSRAPLLDFPWDAEGPEWVSAPAPPACGKAAILEAARASPQGMAALAKTRELLGGPDPYFPDHCHPSPWGAALIARALVCRVSLDRRSL